MPVIDIKNLSVTYFMGKSNEVKALRDVDLQINAGEFIIFFGASGCGKSTLLYTIAGLEKPTGGEVLVTDIDLATMNNKQLEAYRQQAIGMVFQAFYLIPSLSIVKNIMLPQMAIGVDMQKRKAEAERLMKYFGVYEQRNKLPNELSGGQQQRVAICRALINNPEIIFADEPVGNLDSKSAQDVLGLIQELNKKEKKTVILVTHDPSHLDIADRVFFMKDGQIIDTKKNEHVRMITKNAPVPSQTPIPMAKPKKTTLEHVAKTFTKADKIGMGDMFFEYKAKEVVSNALTGLSVEELSSIEHQVKTLLQEGLKVDHILEQYLSTDFVEGGLSLSKRKASVLTSKIYELAEEMKMVRDIVTAPEKKVASHIETLRIHLLEHFDIEVESTDTLAAVDEAIRERLEGITDRKGVQARLDMPMSEGGAGLDKRNARKMAKHLELIMLGRYTGPKK